MKETREYLVKERFMNVVNKLNRIGEVHALYKLAMQDLFISGTSETEMWRHRRYKHRPTKIIPCDRCGLFWETASDVKKHQRGVHLKIKDLNCFL